MISRSCCAAGNGASQSDISSCNDLRNHSRFSRARQIDRDIQSVVVEPRRLDSIPEIAARFARFCVIGSAPMQLVDMVFYWARSVPHRAAIVQPEMVTTYRGLAEAIESISSRIERFGLDKSEPVAVSIANPSMMLATVFALLHCGYRAAPVNRALYPFLPSAGIRSLIYDTHGQMLTGGRNIRFEMSWLPRTDGPASASMPAAPPAYRKTSAGNVGTIFFTSGTTGAPKKIVQSGRSLEQLLSYPFTCASGAHQKILIMPGLTSTFGFNRACEILNIGKTACFAQSPTAVLALVGTFGVEMIIASASQALALQELKNQEPAYPLDQLKAVLVGGGKIAPERMRSVRAALCRTLLSQYGSTEGGVVALAPYDEIAGIPDAVGVVLPWADLEIVDEAAHPLPPGAEGLIRYRTPQLTENIKAADGNEVPGVRGQWFYPGDIGSLTADGVLCLAGRSSDVINRGGVKVSGTRIEEILEALPGIKEAAACAVVGPSGMEEIWVAVVADGPIAIDALKQLLAEHDDVKIAADEVIEFDELPRGELGKVQKFRLRELMLSRKASA
jgi:acyl-coenzyme A synthetase/AMP-(fatty) acid ligase